MLESNDSEANIADQHHEEAPFQGATDDYSAAAREAYDTGDRVLAMHLYLTAYEQGCKRAPLPDMAAIAALREAWKVACELRERSIAEYIYDRLEPHLSSDETKVFAHDLQSMALDKLSEFGISRADLEDMADMISEEIGGNAHIARVTPVASVTMPHGGAFGIGTLASQDSPKSTTAETSAADEQAAASQTSEPASDESCGGGAAGGQKEPSVQPRLTARPAGLADLVGFDSVIDDVRALGIGVKDDEEYRLLIDTLRAQHGLDGLSAAGSIVFRTSSREDASMLMAAVAGELGLPTLRVQIQPGPQGMPVLCVTTAADRPARMNNNRLSLESPSVLVLEDIDMWGAPLMEAASAADGEGVMFASISRAAREAFALIGSAVANPDVYVLASVAGDAFDQGYLFDAMEPMNIVDIYLPDEVERRLIWNAIALEHPSVRQLDLSRLTRLSRNLSRFDIVAAGREAVEEAYRLSLKMRRYVPITQSMMFEHIANFQPLDSDEYRLLEEAVATDFRKHLYELEDLEALGHQAASGGEGEV